MIQMEKILRELKRGNISFAEPEVSRSAVNKYSKDFYRSFMALKKAYNAWESFLDKPVTNDYFHSGWEPNDKMKFLKMEETLANAIMRYEKFLLGIKYLKFK